VAIAFPPVEGATKVLAAAQSIKTFIYEKIYKPAKLSSAWSTYKQALGEKNNEAIKRKAMKMNPTLAKYAIAYGALEMNDPFAKEALRDCGLTDEVLAHKDTNAQRVADYLKLKMADDLEVQGVLNEFVPSGGVPLSLATWNKNKKAAAAKHKWQNTGTGGIDAALAALEKAEAALAKKPDSLKLLTGCQTAAESLVSALEQFKPVTQEGAHHAQFADYVGDLTGEATKKVEKYAKEHTEKEASVRVNRDLQTKRGEQARAAIDALKTDLPAASTFTKPADLLTFCNNGPGRALVGTLKTCVSVSFYLQDPVTLVEDAFDVSGKKMARADQEWKKLDVQETELSKAKPKGVEKLDPEAPAKLRETRQALAKQIPPEYERLKGATAECKRALEAERDAADQELLRLDAL